MKKMILALMLGMFLIGIFAINVNAKQNNDYKNCSGDNDCTNQENQTIGGQRDSHGCLGPAGYSWNETEEKCVREWENGTARYQKEYNESEDNYNNGSGRGLGQMIRNRVRAGVYTNENGDEIRVSELAHNKMRFIVGNKSVDCDENCNISEEKIGNKTRLKMRMSNGSESEIKIMPDRANEKALEKLKLRFCNDSNNCTNQLKEVGKEKQKRAKYEIQVERHKKLLGFFKMKAIEKAQVDAETGETQIVKKPWWAFLATNSD